MNPALPDSMPADRTARADRVTRETSVAVEMSLDGSGLVEVSTGIPFFDHMISQLGKHAGWDLSVASSGDLEVDAHHSVEDVGIVLGQCLGRALGDKRGIRRFASCLLPLDEALVEVALDISGRPYLVYEVPLAVDSPPLGSPPFDPQLAEEFWRAFAMSAQITLHIRLRSGRNTHHILEASFKGAARAIGEAASVTGSEVPSTKGSL
ncbi:MAG: imidazoleglycerol-phosphate dehydratase HisB [Actinobacteria bacterium]|nr:imidazoleglycerol-phosphate dehydratase HisB [Actinomycetota bacterium]